MKITSLNLDVKKDVSFNNGNIVGLTSTYTTADGQTHQAADVWFKAAAPDELRTSVNSLVQAMSTFGEQVSSAATGGALKVDNLNATSKASAMAAVLGQYDSNGQQLGIHQMASTDSTLKLKALEGGNAPGILAAPNK
jgi:hypothetical protein